MPELPEIEIVKRSLFKKIYKAKIVSIKINNKNLRYKLENTFSRNLVGEKILKISRRSKYFILKILLKGSGPIFLMNLILFNFVVSYNLKKPNLLTSL